MRLVTLRQFVVAVNMQHVCSYELWHYRTMTVVFSHCLIIFAQFSETHL